MLRPLRTWVFLNPHNFPWLLEVTFDPFTIFVVLFPNLLSMLLTPSHKFS